MVRCYIRFSNKFTYDMMQEVIIIFSFVKSVDLFAAIILQEILASALGHCLDAGGYIELEYYSVHPFGELRIKKIRGKWFEVDSIEAISCYTVSFHLTNCGIIGRAMLRKLGKEFRMTYYTAGTNYSGFYVMAPQRNSDFFLLWPKGNGERSGSRSSMVRYGAVL